MARVSDSILDFKVLGPLEVSRAGTVLDLGSPRQRALLCLLLTEPNRVVPLDRLVDLLWRDEAPDRATATIQVYISRLRKILEPDRARRAASGVLQTESPGYRLNTPLDRLDSSIFDDLVEAGRRHLAAGKAAAALDCLEQALGRWRGAAFADFATETFVIPEARRLEEARMVAEEYRLDSLLALRRPAEAATRGIGLLTEHPLRERLRGAVMVALYREGRQADALTLAEEGRRQLREQLGLDPSPAIVDLERAILDHDRALLDPTEHVSIAAMDAPASVPNRGRTPTPAGEPLVGRDAELTVAQGIIDDLVAGSGRVIGIPGKPGIGKTRLANEIAKLASATGATVLWARCQELTNPPPYWPFLQVVRSAISQCPAASDLAARPDLAALEVIVPQLSGQSGYAPAIVDLELARARLIDSASTFLLELPQAIGKPVVVVFDDLHWADADSLAVLAAVVPQTAGTQLLVVATARTTPSDQSEPFAQALDMLARERNVVELAPHRLSGEQVAELGRLLFAEELSPTLTDLVHAKADGNPFFTVQLLRLLHAEGSWPADPPERLVPSTVQAVVTRRLSRLPEECAALLTTAAVQGYSFDLGVVAEVCGVSQDRALDLLEIALASGLVVDDGARWRFRHALVADAILQRLTPTRRARTHAEVAQSLSHTNLDGDLYIYETSHHWLEAVPAVGPEPALDPLRAAAAAATRALSLDLAVSLYRRALGLVTSLLPGPDRDRRELEVLVELTAAESWASGHGSSSVEETLRRALALGGTVTDELSVEVLTRALYAMWIHHMVRLEVAAAHARQADLELLAARTGNSLAAAIALETVGVGLVHEGRSQDALAVLEQAADRLAEIEQQGPIEGFVEHPIVHNLIFTSLVTESMGDRTASDRHLVMARERAAQGDSFTRHFAAFFGWMRDVMRDDVDAVEMGLAAAAVDDSWHPFAHATAMRSLFQGWVQVRRGDYQAGLGRIRTAEAAYEANGAALSPMTMTLLADALIHAGHLDEAIDACDQGMGMTDSTGIRHWLPVLCRLRGVARSGLGDTAGAKADLRLAISVAEIQGASRFAEMAARCLAELHFRPEAAVAEAAGADRGPHAV